MKTRGKHILNNNNKHGYNMNKKLLQLLISILIKYAILSFLQGLWKNYLSLCPVFALAASVHRASPYYTGSNNLAFIYGKRKEITFPLLSQVGFGP
jgi:hypothetical protein